MIYRDITQTIQKAAAQFGVISLTGPRQSGKTTLVRSLFPEYTYLNMENLSERNILQTDPVGYLNSVSHGLIIDEVQKYPDILSYIQVHIDEHFKPGKFILTGSQNLLLSEKVSQSLAGRVAVLTLLPLTIDELQNADHLDDSYNQLLLRGFYPGLYDKDQDSNLFYSSYIHTYVERDVRSIKNIGDLAGFERFLQLLAGRIGQLLNLSEIGSAVGVSYKTIESWLSVLEASYVVIKIQPFYENYSKRMVKSPKVYFTDVGLASYLLGIDSTEELYSHFARGPLFENMIVVDIYKRILNELSSSKLYFYRDNSGKEVDLIVDTGGKRTPVEIKASATFQADFLEGIEYYQKLQDEKKNTQEKGSIVYTGDTETEVRDTKLLNWRSIRQVEV